MKFNLKPKTDDESTIEWVSWSKALGEAGEFTFTATKISFKEEPQPTFFLIDEESNTGTSVYCTNHPDSKYPNATPHGVRLANAIGRSSKLDGEVDVEDLLASLEFPCIVQVVKTEKGVLWAIA